VIAARSHHSTNVLGEASERNVRRAVAEARSRSAILRTLEAGGKFSVLGTIYEVASGDLAWLKIAAAATQHTAKTDGHADAHGDEHAHTDDGHGSDAQGKDSHGANAHATHGHAADSHGGIDDLPTMDLATPIGETNAHGDAHGHASGHDNGRASHSGEGHGHGQGDNGHGESDGHEHGGMMSYLKNPIVMIGLSGITALLAAGILVLRRRKA
jgi:hypothetical protein